MRGDRRKTPSEPGAAITNFANRRDRRLKSPVSGILYIGDYIRRGLRLSVPVSRDFPCESPVTCKNEVGHLYHMTFQTAPNGAWEHNWSRKSPSLPESINREIHSRFSHVVRRL